ncbi:MAG: YaaA family protein [Coprobacillus sp.]
MKIIIAPSKTMKYKDYGFEISNQNFIEETKYLYTLLKQYNDEELCELMKISYKQALTVYDFYHKQHDTYPALSLYQGTVFKQLQIDQYQNHLDYLDKHICIMSAYYGILKYNSGISPYRLDMTMKLQNINLYEYWYTPIYQYFQNEDIVISLASKEFTDMIHHPYLYFIDFIEIIDNKIKRNAMIIKKARGLMLNQMILNEIKTLEQLKKLNIDGFIYDESFSHNQILCFIKK